ncbi:hypothetical protein L3Y34_004863 [Caenorhabditis briggsae]|nr:hypothetical protein L3Y34_004863 [Caenorhabditis briggsae]
MDGLLSRSGSTGKDAEKTKDGLKALGDLMKLSEAAKQNDTVGATNALITLTQDLMKYAHKNNETTLEGKGKHNHHHIWQSQSTNKTDSMEYMNDTQTSASSWKSKLQAFLQVNNDSNSTDYGNNYAASWGDSTGFGSNEDSQLPNLSLFDFGLGGGLLEPFDLNKAYSHNTFMNVFCTATMISFVYYVPRMIYYRANNLSNDKKHSSFVPIFFLSLIAISGAIIHIANSYYYATHNPLAVMMSGNFSLEDLFAPPDHLTPMFYKTLTASINRIVSPIVSLLCLQQISTHSQHNINFLQNPIVQMIYCLISSGVVFGYSYYEENEFMNAYADSEYPDQIHVDFSDIIPPLITAFLFFFAKHTISRQSLYTTEKYGPNGPTTLDRVSKVVVFQTVMVFFALCAIFWSPSREEELALSPLASTWYYFFITAQTPVVHIVLFRSLLRSRKSTRICFLVCCHSGEKVDATADNGVELNQHPKINEPSEKNDENRDEEDQNEEENTMETLDHNKIVIIPDGALLEGKPEVKEA